MKQRISLLISILAMLLFANRSSGTTCTVTCNPDETPIDLDTLTVSCSEQACNKTTCTADDFPEAFSGFIPPLCEFSHPWHLNGGNNFLCWDECTYSPGVFHPGMDLNQISNAEAYQPVHATADGYVVAADPYKTNWGSVLIKHRWKDEIWYSQYGHMDTVTVNSGDCVCRGQVIGTVGKNHALKEHLHFEIRSNDHPGKENLSYWTTDLGVKANVETWYRDPLTFVMDHDSYDCGNGGSQMHDVPCWHWALEYWNEMVKRHIFEGTLCPFPDIDLCLYPERTITRAEVAKVAVKALKIPLTDPPPYDPFVDIRGNSMEQYIATLWRLGVVSGCDATHYCPDTPATRAEAAKILIKAAKSQGYAITVNTTCLAAPYTDVPVSHPLCPYVEAAKGYNFVNGYPPGTTYKPNNSMTRSEAARIVYDMLASLGIP